MTFMNRRAGAVNSLRVKDKSDRGMFTASMVGHGAESSKGSSSKPAPHQI
jgi:hypothetical protein